ncbi:MAG TPA: 30S ribosomal protein THX [Bacteroidia bacterium]
MGKGDIRSRRGKVWRGTTGVSRPRQKSKPIRTVVPSRNVKSLKDLPKVVAEPVVKHEVLEAVKTQEVEMAAPVAEVNHPVVENVAVESAHVEVTAEAKDEKKAVAKKPRKPAAKKAPAKKKE